MTCLCSTRLSWPCNPRSDTVDPRKRAIITKKVSHHSSPTHNCPPSQKCQHSPKRSSHTRNLPSPRRNAVCLIAGRAIEFTRLTIAQEFSAQLAQSASDLSSYSPSTHTLHFTLLAPLNDLQARNTRMRSNGSKQPPCPKNWAIWW